MNWKAELNPKWKGGISGLWYQNLMLKSGITVECIECKSKDGIEIHHKNKNRKDNRIENLEYRCKKCHKKEHPQFHTETEKLRISRTLKEGYMNGSHKIDPMIAEKGRKTRFKQGHIPWFKKLGFNSSHEAIIHQRGYFNKIGD